MVVNFLGSSVLNTGNLYKLLNYNDTKSATSLSLWDRFLDFFRCHKKKEVVDTFHELIHGEHKGVGGERGENKFYCFEQLKRLANDESKNLFKTHIEYQGPYLNKYTFSIGSDNILSFHSQKNGHSLADLQFAGSSLVDNYESIVFNYMKEKKELFLSDYNNTKTDSEFGTDELMDYSCFFLKNNNEIKNELFEHGLINLDVMDSLRMEMDGLSNEEDDHFALRDNRRSYILTIIASSLISLYQLDSNYM